MGFPFQFGRSTRHLLGMVKTHPDVIPLVGCLAFAGGIATYMSIYTAVMKNDVVWNRWKPLTSEQTTDWTKVTQRLLVPRSIEHKAYQEDPVLKGLLAEIYADGRYNR